MPREAPPKGRSKKPARTLIGQLDPGLLAKQLSRVLEHIDAAPSTQESLLSVLRGKRMLPPALLEAVQSQWAEMSPSERSRFDTPLSLAVGFSVAAYPQKPSHLTARREELKQRLFAFRTAWHGSGNEPFAHLDIRDRLPASLGSEQLEEFLADLSGAKVAAADASDPGRSFAELFLATLPGETIAGMAERWAAEGGLLRFVRANLSTSPSCLINRPSPTVSELVRLFPRAHAEHLAEAVGLEEWARQRTRATRHAALGAQLAEDVFAAVWAHLDSGFPYFSFQSKFRSWWRQVFENHMWRRIKEIEGAPSVPGPNVALDGGVAPSKGKDPGEGTGRDASASGQLDLAELRGLREAYLYVRATFFRRRDLWEADSQRLADGGGQGQSWGPSEELRRMIDRLWYLRLERRLSGEKVQQMVQDVTKAFPGLGYAVVNNVNHRLRSRIFAYVQAHFGRRGFSDICAALTQRRADTNKLLDRSELAGLRKIAALAQVVPEDETFLWAYCAHVYWTPRLEPASAHGWSVRDLVRELWPWLTEPGFEASLLRTENQALREPVQRGMQAVDWLVTALREVPDRDALDAFVADLDVERVSASIREALSSFGGFAETRGFRMSCEECIKAWRAVRQNHLVVPIWYLTFLEQLDSTELLERLNLEPAEREAAARLQQLMQEPEHEGCPALPGSES